MRTFHARVVPRLVPGRTFLHPCLSSLGHIDQFVAANRIAVVGRRHNAEWKLETRHQCGARSLGYILS